MEDLDLVADNEDDSSRFDHHYEFDAPQIYDFTREESHSDVAEVERWFEFSGDYPPSREHYIYSVFTISVDWLIFSFQLMRLLRIAAYIVNLNLENISSSNNVNADVVDVDAEAGPAAACASAEAMPPSSQPKCNLRRTKSSSNSINYTGPGPSRPFPFLKKHSKGTQQEQQKRSNIN